MKRRFFVSEQSPQRTVPAFFQSVRSRSFFRFGGILPSFSGSFPACMARAGVLFGRNGPVPFRIFSVCSVPILFPLRRNPPVLFGSFPACMARAGFQFGRKGTVRSGLFFRPVPFGPLSCVPVRIYPAPPVRRHRGPWITATVRSAPRVRHRASRGRRACSGSSPTWRSWPHCRW